MRALKSCAMVGTRAVVASSSSLALSYVLNMANNFRFRDERFSAASNATKGLSGFSYVIVVVYAVALVVAGGVPFIDGKVCLGDEFSVEALTPSRLDRPF